MKYILWNATDGLHASQTLFATPEQAEAYKKLFLKRFEMQGYYLTFRRERIPISAVQLEVVAATSEEEQEDNAGEREEE